MIIRFVTRGIYLDVCRIIHEDKNGLAFQIGDGDSGYEVFLTDEKVDDLLDAINLLRKER